MTLAVMEERHNGDRRSVTLRVLWLAIEQLGSADEAGVKVT